MTVPILLNLKKRYPRAKVTVLTKQHFTPIFKNVPGVSTYVADVRNRHKGLLGLRKLYVDLRQLSITHVADLHNVLRSNILGFFFRINGIPVVKQEKGRAEKKALTKDANKEFSPLKTTFERYGLVFTQLGFEVDLKEVDFLPKSRLTSSRSLFVKRDKRIRVGIAPFAAYPSKMYRLDLMEQVIRTLLAKLDCNILLFGGGKNEKEQLEMIDEQFDDQVQNVAGELSFDDELSLISNLDVMLAMDSGNGHLAANYGVPVVTIWGVTHPYAGFTPFRQPANYSLLPDRAVYPLIPTSVYGNKYPETYEDAINSIPPEAIVEKVMEVLGQKPKLGR